MARPFRAQGTRELVTLLGLGLLGVAFLRELVSFAWVPVARDMQMFFVPQRHLVWEALRNGRIPLWTPYYGTGAPLLANFQSGIFYPPHWLYAILDFFPAFDLLIVLHFCLGGGAMYAFARQLEMSRAASAVAGSTFMLGGYFASLLNLLNALQAAAWVPLVGWALLRHVKNGSPLTFLALVGTLVLGFLAGEPQTFFIGSFAVGGFVLLRVAGDHPSRRELLGRLGSLGLAGACALGLAMIQLLPTWEMVSESSRAGGLSYEEATGFSIDPLRLLHLVFPPDYSDPVYRFGVKSQIGTMDPWLFSIYLGVLPLGLAAFARFGNRRRWERWYWSGAILAGILLGLGDDLPIYRWLFESLPGFGAFRFPEKFFFASGLGVAVLAGWGVDALARHGPPRRFRAFALAVLGTAGVAKLAWLTGKETVYRFAREHMATQNFVSNFDFAWRAWGRNLDTILVLVVAALATLWLWRRGRIGAAVAVPVLGLFAVLDLFVAHRGLNPVVEARFYAREPMLLRYLPAEEVRLRYRYRATPFDRLSGILRIQPGVALEAQKWLWQQTLAPNTSQYWRILAPDTWDAIKLSRYVDQHEISRVLPDDERRWRMLQLTSVKYVYHRAWLEDGAYRAAILLDSLPGYLYEVADPVPRAYLARGEFHADEVEALNAALDVSRSPAERVALLGSQPPLPPEGSANGARSPASEPEGSADRPGDAVLVSDTGEEVRIRLRVREPAYLVLTDSYYPGWKAFADGEERPVYRANYFFRAVPVRPGDREVVFRYRSAPFERGRWISAATLLLLLGGVGTAGRRRRRGRAAGTRGESPPNGGA